VHGPADPYGDRGAARRVDVWTIELLHGLNVKRGAGRPVHDPPHLDLFSRAQRQMSASEFQAGFTAVPVDQKYVVRGEFERGTLRLFLSSCDSLNHITIQFHFLGALGVEMNARPEVCYAHKKSALCHNMKILYLQSHHQSSTIPACGTLGLADFGDKLTLASVTVVYGARRSTSQARR
jgi:hypothetical protein